MNGKRRRLIDEIGNSPAFVPAGSRITGDFETPGALVLGGSVRGDGNVSGALRMATGSSWEGEVRAQHGIIAGRIVGKLVIKERLEVGTTAVIHADVTAGSIAIAKGAVIQGEVTVTSGQPVLQFEEKRRD